MWDLNSTTLLDGQNRPDKCSVIWLQCECEKERNEDWKSGWKVEIIQNRWTHSCLFLKYGWLND